MPFTFRNVVQRPLYFSEADENLQTMEDMYTEALQAQDAATLNAGIYASTTAGLAATTNGQYFSVPSAGTDVYLELYRNNAGSAVLTKTYYSRPQAAMEEAGSYAVLDAYTGSATVFYVRCRTNIFDGAHGVFRRDDTDTTTAASGICRVDALGRRWKREFAGAINVKWFGATGDGTTDDTTALQAGITAAASDTQYGGPALYLPSGRYKITAALVIPKQFISIAGDGPWQSQILFNGVAGGGLTCAAIAYVRPTLSDFAIVGNSASGIALDFSGVTSQVYLGELRNLYLQAGQEGLYAPKFFSMTVQNVSSLSYNSHSFRVACGPGVFWSGCYALQTGAGKAGYRLRGIINMFACNGVNSGDWWGIFGQDTTATDGYQNDFPGAGNDLPDINLVGCNVEEYASVSTNGGGILVHHNYRNFNFIGGKFDRNNLSTSYKAIIHCRKGGNVSGMPVRLSPGVVYAGGGAPSLASLYTDSGAIFSDDTGAFTGVGITTWRDNGASLNYPLLRMNSSADVYGDRAYFFNAISPRRITCEVMRYKELEVTTVNANPDQPATDVTGYTKLKITPATASVFSRFSFTTTIGAGADYDRNGELIIEAGNGNVTLHHNYGAGNGIRLKGGTNKTLAQGEIVRLMRSSNYQAGVTGWVEV